RQAETVSSSQVDLVAHDFHADTGEHRQRIIFTCSGCHLGDCFGEQLGVDGTGTCRKLGQHWVIIKRDQWQLEAGRTTSDKSFGSVDAEINGLVGQRSCDFRQQLAGYCDATWLRYLS